MNDRLLELEAQHDLWSTEVYDFKLWPLVRFYLLTGFIMKEQGYAPLRGEGRKMYLLPNKWPLYLRTVPFLFANRSPQYSALFWIPNVHRYPDGNAHSFDRRYSEFYEAIENRLIFETAPGRYSARPDRCYKEAIFSQDILWLWVTARAKLNAVSADATHQINDFAHFLAEIYDVPHLRPNLVALMIRFINEYRVLRPLITNLIAPKLKYKIAFVEDAGYMGRVALVTRIFHDLGFQVIEPQHGLINKVHYAYQFPQAYFAPNHPSNQYLPDSYLTYGQYWSDIAHTPAKKIVIGLPYLMKMAQRAIIEVKPTVNQILLLSASVVSEPTAALAERLARAFPNQMLIFKLHPLEDPADPAYAALGSYSNIQVVHRSDVCQLIAESSVIVSFYTTTVLVEALVFPNKRIFFHELGTLPTDIGEHFEDADELIDLIKDPNRGYSGRPASDFWADDWQENLARFVRKMVS